MAIVLKSRMLTMRITMEFLSWQVGLGSYRILLGLSADDSQANFALITYVVRVETVSKGYYQGNPDLPELKSWARQVSDVLQASLDENSRWESVKQMLEARQLAPVAAEVMRNPLK